METKINAAKLRELLHEGNKEVSNFEKHIIQEGVKHLLFGTFPGSAEKSITQEMHVFLKESGIIEDVGNPQYSPKGHISDEPKKGSSFDESDIDNILMTPKKAISPLDNDIHTLSIYADFQFASALKHRIGEPRVFLKKGYVNNAEFFGTKRDWNDKITEDINEMSGLIHRESKSGGANAIICSPDVVYMFEDNLGFISDYEEKELYAMHGILNGRYTIYSDPKMNDGRILVTRFNKGTSIESVEKQGLYYGIIKVVDSKK